MHFRCVRLFWFYLFAPMGVSIHFLAKKRKKGVEQEWGS